MKLKKVMALMVSSLMTLSIVSCGSANGSTTKTGDSDTLFTIGFSNCSQDTPFFANMTPIIEKYAKTKNIKVIS